MPNLKHLVVTRLNIKFSHPKTGKTEDRIFKDDWIFDRLSYFKTYCLPSITNQINNNFVWLIYSDVDTKPEFKKKFEELMVGTPFHSEIRYVNNNIDMVNDTRDFASNLCEEKSDILITTRFDTDDSIHENAIQKIQESVKDNLELMRSEERIAINLLYGYQLRIRPFHELVWKKNYSNPFISMVESINDPQTVYTYHHANLKDIKIIDVTDDFYWLQTVHNANRSSIVIGWPTHNVNRLKPFHFDLSHIEINRLSFLGSIYRRILFSMKGRLRSLLKPE